MDDKIILGIHSNVDPQTNPSLIDGHAWLTVTRNGQTQTYGLWPDNHQLVQDRKLSNGDASDIRTGMEAKLRPAESRYYELTPQQYEKLQGELRQNVHWGYTNTCASWASGVASKVTGEKIDASELLGATDTPRELSKSIEALEQQHKTSKEQPTKHEPAEHHSSSLSQRSDATEPAGHPAPGGADTPARGQGKPGLSSSDQAMLGQIQGHLEPLRDKLGQPDDASFDRLSHGLLAACKDNAEFNPARNAGATVSANALHRVDDVVLAANGNLFAVQGDRQDPASLRAHVPAGQAMQVPVEQSLDKVHAANQTMAQEQSRAQQHDLARTQQPMHEAPSRSV